MNTLDIMKYGNLTVRRALEDVPDTEWETGGVCGWWSVKNIIAHLASFEETLVEVLNSCLDHGANQLETPLLDRFARDPLRFNDEEVAARKHLDPMETLASYEKAHERAMLLARQIPDTTFRQTGIIPWYGMEYDLDDLIVYNYYGHKREHMAQVDVFKDRLKRKAKMTDEGSSPAD